MRSKRRFVILLVSLSLAVPFGAFATSHKDVPSSGDDASDSKAMLKAKELKNEVGLSKEELHQVARAYQRAADIEATEDDDRVSTLVRRALDSNCRGECLAERLRVFREADSSDRAEGHSRSREDKASRDRPTPPRQARPQSGKAPDLPDAAHQARDKGKSAR